MNSPAICSSVSWSACIWREKERKKINHLHATSLSASFTSSVFTHAHLRVMKDVYKNTPLKIFLPVIIRQCHLWGPECDTLKMIARLSDTEFITQLLNRRGFICTTHSIWFICCNSASRSLRMQRLVIHRALSLKWIRWNTIYNRINSR